MIATRPAIRFFTDHCMLVTSDALVVVQKEDILMVSIVPGGAQLKIQQVLPSGTIHETEIDGSPDRILGLFSELLDWLGV